MASGARTAAWFLVATSRGASFEVTGLPPMLSRSVCRAERRLDCDFRTSEIDELHPRGVPIAPEGSAAAATDELVDLQWPETQDRPQKRLVVLVSGVVDRFYPIPTLRHVVAPAVRAGYTVDYYVLLSNATGPEAFRAWWYRPVANPQFTNFSADDLEAYVMQRGRAYGASRVGLFLLPQEVSIEPLPLHVFQSKRVIRGERHGLRDGSERFDATNTFWLFLMRLKKVEMLWNWTSGKRLAQADDHVVWTRSDTFWVDDMNMGLFPDPARIYVRPLGNLCRRPNYESINDQAFVMGGRVAGHFLMAYSAFYRNKNRHLDSASDSESFLQLLAQVIKVPLTRVRPDWMPFWQGLHMPPNLGASPVFCLRGINSRHITNPEGECVEPWRIRLPFCDDFELQ